MKTKVYNTFEDAYKGAFGKMLVIARGHLFTTDYAIDAVQDAFTKVVIYLNKHKKTNISEFILKRETLRACRRINKKFNHYYESSYPSLDFVPN